jgi:hypothetical protein
MSRTTLLAACVRACLALSVPALALLAPTDAAACCPAPPSGKPVVNADQTVIMVWDAAAKTEHFVRRASFKSDADDFGFLVPTPAQPELAESGDDAFPYLAKLTAPEIKRMARPSAGCAGGCSRSKSAAVPASAAAKAEVTVLEEKTVAGFHAVVLDASSASALTGWLKDHGYAFSPEIEAWAKPYVDGGWKITALKVAKDPSATASKGVAAASLRISFKTERPLFPYREPESKRAADALGISGRTLRIFMVADARMDGELTKDSPWTGNAVWAKELRAEDRTHLLESLKLPPTTGPAKAWLTELEDQWPYRAAPADLYFSRAAHQDKLERPPIIEYYSANDRDATWLLAGVFVVPMLSKRRRRV